MASRFWVPIAVTNLTNNGSGLCRVTVGAGLATGKVTGETVIIAGIVGATEGNGTWVITAVSSTQFDLQGSTFGLAYVSGGTISGGTWNSTNIGNWSASTGGAGGQTVPGSSDTVTLDGASNTSGSAATCTVNTTVTVQSITCGAYVGTLDFSANNNNVTLSASGGMSLTGTATRTINLGNGTWKLTATAGGAAPWNALTTTGLTFNANSSTIQLSAVTSGQRTVNLGALTYNIISVDANSSFGPLSFGGAATVATFNISMPNFVTFSNTATLTITNAFNWAGTSAGEFFVQSASITVAATISVASGAPTMAWAAIHAMAFTGGATFTATNSFDGGINTGITITPPGGAARSRVFTGF